MRRLAVYLLGALLALPAAHGALAHDSCEGPAFEACQTGHPPSASSAASDLCPWCLASSQARTLLRPGPGAALAVPPGSSEIEAPPSRRAPTPRALGLAAPRAPPTPS